MHYKQFKSELYAEHIDELAFLIEQRQSLLSAWDIQWTSLADEESRITAHLDGLLVGGKQARLVLQHELEQHNDDPFYIYIAFALAYSADDVALFNFNLDHADLTAPEACDAVRFATIDFGQQAAAIQKQIGMLTDSAEVHHLLLVSYYVFKNPELLEKLLARCQNLASQHYADYIKLITYSNHANTQQLLAPFLSHADNNLRQLAAYGLVIFGDTSVRPFLREWAPQHSWAANLLAVTNQQDAEDLAKRLQTEGKLSRDFVYILGMIGSQQSVQILASLLDDEELGIAAMLSLYVIFGHGPMSFAEQQAKHLEVLDQSALSHYDLTPPQWRQYIESVAQPDNGALRLGDKKCTQAILNSLSDELIPNPMRQQLFIEAHRQNIVPISLSARSFCQAFQRK